jgi:hypothetical protein
MFYAFGELRRVLEVEKEFEGNKYTRITLKVEQERNDIEIVLSRKQVENKDQDILISLVGEKMFFPLNLMSKTYKDSDKVFNTFYLAAMPDDEIIKELQNSK